MLLKNVMWNIFQDTGCIEAYLYYRSCQEEENGLERKMFEDQRAESGEFKQ